MDRKRAALAATFLVSAVVILGLGGAVQAGVILSDVEARYELTGNSNDTSGNDYHGVDTDMSYVADVVRGTAASFDGITSSINASTTGLAYSFGDTPNDQFAVSFWIKPTVVDSDTDGKPDTNIIMSGWNPGKGVIEIVGDVGSWGGMGGTSAYGGVGVNSGGGGGKTGRVAIIDLYDGDWHHVLIQWAGDPNSDIEVWIDANAAATFGNGYNGSSTVTTAIRLGGPATWSNGGGSDKYYTGLMSDVILFNRQILDSEVGDVMSGNVPEPSCLLLLAGGGLALLRRRRK